MLGRGRCQIPPPQAAMCTVGGVRPGPAGHPDPACPGELAGARYCRPSPVTVGGAGVEMPLSVWCVVSRDVDHMGSIPQHSYGQITWSIIWVEVNGIFLRARGQRPSSQHNQMHNGINSNPQIWTRFKSFCSDTNVTYLTIIGFNRHVPRNLRAYILDTTMSWGSLQLVVPDILTSSPSMPLG